MKIPGTYIDGFLLPIPKDRVEDYRKLAEQAAAIWTEHGALQYTECAIDDFGADFCSISSRPQARKNTRQ